MNPKDAVTISMKFGLTPAISSAGKTAVFSRYAARRITAVTMIGLIFMDLIYYCSPVSFSPVSSALVVVITRTSWIFLKSTAGVI